MELFIIRNGEQTGPFSTDTITALLNTGSVKPEDMAWRKGLSGWLPLSQAMSPETTQREEPPPLNGLASPKRKATAKQKALLSFLGAVFQDDITKDEAAVVISDAIESPKLSGKFGKWNEEKLRLHADVFQDEIDYRRANRVARYLEQCQTEGNEAVKDVTKAHVQVLIESLDKRNPTWEQEPRRALWDFLLPCVAEHFPQLVKDDWKGKLRFGGAPKIAAAVAATPTAATLTPPNPPPGAIHAAMRGVIYGVIVLGLVLGGFYWWENRKNDGTQGGQTVAAKSNEPEKKPVAPAHEPPAPAPDPAPAPAHPTETVAIAAKPPEEPAKPEPAPPVENPAAMTEKPATPAVAANTTPPAMTEPVPVTPAPAPASSNPSPTFTPAPPPPPVSPAPAPAPSATATTTPAPAPGAAKDYATMTKAVAVQLQFGRVILQVGTRVKFIAVEGQNARVTFNNNVILVPLAATDIDPNALPATAQTNPLPPAAPLPPTTPPAPAPPTTTNTPVKPSSDL